MFRRTLFDQGLRHHKEYFICENYRLWTDLIGKTKMAKVDEVLLHVRFSDHHSTRNLIRDKEKHSIRRALMGEIHKAAFRNLGLTFSEEDMRAYNQYILQMRPEVSYSPGEIREITRLCQIVGSQLNDLHPGYLPGFTQGMEKRFPFISFI